MTSHPARFVRPDADRHLRPDAARFRGPDRAPAPNEVAGAVRPLAMVGETKFLAADLAAIRHEFAALCALLRLKANFNPNQPRDEHGRWTGTGAKTPALAKTGRATRALKNIIRRAADMAVRQAVGGPVGTLMNLVEAGELAAEFYPYARSSFDDPKSLEELQAAVFDPQPGYEIHHIVEQTAADRDGFSRERIDAPENLVRVPTLKHWEINAWYMTGNNGFGGLSPREYLEGKDWDTRTEVGRLALVKFGVLKQ